MRSYKVRLKDLFDFLNVGECVDQLYENNEEIFIKTPTGVAPILGFVRKEDKLLNIRTETSSVLCGSKHVLFSNGLEVFAKAVNKIDFVDRQEDVYSIVPQGVGSVYDISLPAPHVYVTLNGMVHHNTTTAKALCNELNMDTLILNCSENGNIDTIRTQVRDFASTISLMGGVKCVIFDESDGLTNASQSALRNFIEEFSNNCRFIFTANFGNKIIEPLKSRTVQVDFNFTKDEKFEILKQFDKRVKEILQAEGIAFDSKVLAQIIMRYFPDMRKCLNELQRLTINGSLDASAMSAVSMDVVREIFGFLKGKKFTEMRKWVAVNPDLDFPTLSRLMWNGVDDYVQGDSIPQLLLHLNQYQVNDAIVADKEINLIAFLTEVMVDVEFR